VSDPAATMRRAADRLRRYGFGPDMPFLPIEEPLADWLEDAANDAEVIGPDRRAERVAAVILGLADPWPAAKPPRRPVPEAKREVPR
jgi:hypothetical protein